jgi:hypothetical protein
MKTIAFCTYNLDSNIKISISKKFNEYDVSFFEIDRTDNIYLDILSLSRIKRNYELDNYIDFDICALMTTNIKIEDINIDNITDNEFIFYSGKQISSVIIEIDYNFYYSATRIFDRAAEFMYNKDIGNIKNAFGEVSSAGLFYCHLKSLGIKTRCMNVENSSLFIRAT